MSLFLYFYFLFVIFLSLNLIQHKNYINILIDSKIELFTLNALEDYPDSMFVEDPAITYKDFCIILRPGAHSRFGEQTVFKNEAKDYFDEVFVIENGSIEGGDILNINENFIIGLSESTDILNFRILKASEEAIELEYESYLNLEDAAEFLASLGAVKNI